MAPISADRLVPMGYALSQQRSNLLGLAPGSISFASLGPWSPRRCTYRRLWWEVGDGYSFAVLDLRGFYFRTDLLSDSLNTSLSRGFPFFPLSPAPAPSCCVADFLSPPALPLIGPLALFRDSTGLLARVLGRLECCHSDCFVPPGVLPWASRWLLLELILALLRLPLLSGHSHSQHLQQQSIPRLLLLFIWGCVWYSQLFCPQGLPHSASVARTFS